MAHKVFLFITKKNIKLNKNIYNITYEYIYEPL